MRSLDQAISTKLVLGAVAKYLERIGVTNQSNINWQTTAASKPMPLNPEINHLGEHAFCFFHAKK